MRWRAAAAGDGGARDASLLRTTTAEFSAARTALHQFAQEAGANPPGLGPPPPGLMVRGHGGSTSFHRDSPI